MRGKAMVTNGEHHGRRAALAGDDRRRFARPSIRCWSQRRMPVIGGFVGATARGRHDDAGPGRIGLLGGDHRRVPRRDGDSDLDGRGRHAHRRSAHRQAHAASCRICRLPKRQSWRISAPRCCIRRRFSRRWRSNIPVRILNSQRPLDSEGTLMTGDRPARRRTADGGRVQEGRHGRRHRIDAHADGARISRAGFSRHSSGSRRRSTS